MPAAYPHLSLTALGEDFGPRPQDCTLSLSLKISTASGRRDDAQYNVRELAHQLRAALLASRNASGAAASLRVAGIKYGIAAGAEPVVATAELSLEMSYILPG
jgi:hypothetical protein